MGTESSGRQLSAGVGPGAIPYLGEVFLDQLLDNSDLLVVIADRGGRFLRVSRRLTRYFEDRGIDPIGKSPAEVFPAQVAAQIVEHNKQVLQNRQMAHFEEQVEVSGSLRSYLCTRLPIFDPEGEVCALCTIATDVTERRRVGEALQHAALGVSASQSDEVYRQIVRYLAVSVHADLAFIATLKAEEPGRAEIVAGYLDGQFLPTLEYRLAGTPCNDVMGREFVHVPERLLELYPGDGMGTQLGLQSYAAYPLFGSQGAALGLIAVCRRRPLSNGPLLEAMLKIFSTRAAAEMERSRAEKALELSEANYRQIFEASEDAIFVHEFDTGTVLDVNPKACTAYGYSREELLRIDVAKLSAGEPPYTGKEAGLLLERARSGETVRTEWHRRNKDGTLHWDELVLKPAVLAGERRILAFTREISERKRAEQALRASEAQYRGIFNASVDGLAVWNPEGRMVDVNPAFERMRGYSREELLALDPRKLIHPDSWPEMERFLACMRRSEPFRAEVRGLRRDGAELELEVHGVPVQYHGAPHMLAVVRDITESKRASEGLRRSEERLRTTVEASLDCIISMDASGRITGFNPAAETCFGIRGGDALGRPLHELVIPERFREAHLRGLDRHLQTGEGPFLGQRVEVDAMRADGSEFPAELAISVAQGPDGNVYLGYLRDISEQRRAEVERAELERQLRQAQKMEAIGHLTGGIAHDFNNILTSILGYAVMSAERAEARGDEKLMRYLQQIRLSGERARDLIRQMLTFSRGQKGEPRPLALPALVQESVKLYGSSFPSSLEIGTDFEPGVSPVLADPIQVEQALMNLCINARDAMEGVGRVALTVRERSQEGAVCASCRKRFSGRFVELVVSDNGPGICPEVLERMFEPFFSTKEVGRGSGMGLSTTHGIVHDLGGHVLVETAPGAGATFRVLLPLAQGAAGQLQTASGDGPRFRQRYRGHLLVVDDESSVREFMRELLEGQGFTVTLASDGFEALGKLEGAAGGIDLVITDQTMPRVSGLELAALLNVRRPGLPIVLYTGLSEDISGQRALASGVRAVLGKPLNLPQLFETIIPLIESSRASA